MITRTQSILQYTPQSKCAMRKLHYETIFSLPFLFYIKQMSNPLFFFGRLQNKPGNKATLIVVFFSGISLPNGTRDHHVEQWFRTFFIPVYPRVLKQSAGNPAMETQNYRRNTIQHCQNQASIWGTALDKETRRSSFMHSRARH